MRYLLAIFVPPLAVILCGKLGQAVFNGTLWIIALVTLLVGVGFGIWVVCSIHAILVVNNYLADKRNNKVIEAIKTRG